MQLFTRCNSLKCAWESELCKRQGSVTERESIEPLWREGIYNQIHRYLETLAMFLPQRDRLQHNCDRCD